MIDLIKDFLPTATLVAHIVFVIILLAIVFRKTWGQGIITWLGQHSLKIVFVVSLSAVIGSLFYSNIVGFLPCVLCWWQRVFLYPVPIIAGLAILKRDNSAFLYIVPLALISGIIALYQSYVNLGGASILPCTAVGAECSKLYVIAYGYITIPLMSLTVAIYVLLIAWAKKIYDKDSNA